MSSKESINDRPDWPSVPRLLLRAEQQSVLLASLVRHARAAKSEPDFQQLHPGVVSIKVLEITSETTTNTQHLRGL